jgi:hypothetical protein
MAPAPGAAVAVAAAVLVLAPLGGALAQETLGVAAAMAASSAMAPAVAMFVAERLAAGIAPGRRLHSGLAAAEQALQPAEESPGGRLGLRSDAVGRKAGLAARALIELWARLPLRLVPAGIAPFLPRLAAALLPAIGAE